MPERMQAILMTTVTVNHTGRDLQGVPAAIRYVGVTFDVAVTVGKDEPELALGASQFPFAQCVDDHRRHWDFAIPRCGFRRTDLAPKIRALPHVNHLALEVDIVPRQTAEFGGAHPSENSGHKEGPPPPLGFRKDRLYFFLRGDVPPDGEL